MRVTRLEAENFKRLKAVSIVPKGNVVEITGDNAEGKTSVLDTIWAAMGGKDAVPQKPIRDGATSGSVSIQIGEPGEEPKYIVTRTFKLKDGVPFSTDLKVESGEGARFDSPQGILNGLFGVLAFDPLAFTLMKPEEQVVACRKFVPGFDFALMEGRNKKDYEDRTDVNRKAKELRAQASALPSAEGDIPVRVDLATLEQALADASDHNTLRAQREAGRQQAEERATGHADRAKGLREQAAVLITQAEEEEGLHDGLRQQIDNAEALPAAIDVQDTQQQLAAGRQTNALIDRVDERRRLEALAGEAEEQSVTLTQAIATRLEVAAQAVQAAKMPVEGLGFGDGFVTFNGQPFEQASKAQQIRASVAIAAAMNPKLRVARIMDGSLLDGKSWAALEQYADEHDLQVWVETVQQHGASAVLIEDGGVVSAVDEKVAAVAEVGDVI